MVTQAQADAALAPVYASKTGNILNMLMYRLSFGVFGTMVSDLDGRMASNMRYVQNIKPHLAGWIREQILNWRWDSVGNASYPFALVDGLIVWQGGDNDANAKIVTACALQESDGYCTVLVAKGQPGSLAPLSSPQVAALQSYIDAWVRILGSVLVVASYPPDALKVGGTIRVNASLGIDNIPAQIVAALANYITTQLEFNGEVSRTKIVDVIQSVPGVLDVDGKGLVLQYRPDGATDWININYTELLTAGYGVLTSAASDFTLELR